MGVSVRLAPDHLGMTIDDTPGDRRRRFRRVNLLAFSVVALLMVVGLVAYLVGGRAWLEVTAVGGTAVGTLALALYTQDLAARTADVVSESRDLERIAQEQLGAAQRQADEARRGVEAAHRSASEAAQARIDASAPLLALHVELRRVRWEREGTIPRNTGIVGSHSAGESDAPLIWGVDDVTNYSFRVELKLIFTNYGKTPATLELPAVFPDFLSLTDQASPPRRRSVPPTQTHEEVLPVIVGGNEVENPKAVELAITYFGPLYEAVDTLSWRGTLQPVLLQDGKYRPNYRPVLVDSPATVNRRYPSLLTGYSAQA